MAAASLRNLRLDRARCILILYPRPDTQQRCTRPAPRNLLDHSLTCTNSSSSAMCSTRIDQKATPKLPKTRRLQRSLDRPRSRKRCRGKDSEERQICDEVQPGMGTGVAAVAVVVEALAARGRDQQHKRFRGRGWRGLRKGANRSREVSPRSF